MIVAVISSIERAVVSSVGMPLLRSRRSALASLFVQLAMQLDQDLASQVKSKGKRR